MRSNDWGARESGRQSQRACGLQRAKARQRGEWLSFEAVRRRGTAEVMVNVIKQVSIDHRSIVDVARGFLQR
jgi:hypothetical protein